MRKLVMSAMASAVLLGASSAAFAECPTGSTGLPNSKWSWRMVVIEGGPIGNSWTEFSNIDQSGKSGNVFADIEVKQEVQLPGHQCIAVNPGGNDVLDKSMAPIGGETEIQTISSEEAVKVCQNNSTTPLAGYTGTCPG